MSRNCFWDHYGTRRSAVGQFFTYLETVPEVFANLTRPSSLLDFKVVPTFSQVTGQLSYCRSPGILIRAFKNVSVVKVLKCFRTQVDTDLLQQINLYQDNRKHRHNEVN